MERLPETRVSDAERERVAVALREHLVDGRLTLEELSQRLERVYEARTDAELAAVTADLPAPATAPAEPRRGSRWVVSVLGGVDKRGRWRVAERLRVLTVMGGCQLDLRGAELASAEVEIECLAVMGGVDVIVPEGVEVELSGFALMGGNDLRLGDERPPPGAPRVRVRAFSVMGGIDVRTRTGRR